MASSYIITMSEIKVLVADEFVQEIEDLELDVPAILKEALISKITEKQIAKSKALQKVMFESIVARSKLTEEDARLLSDKIKEGMFQELQKRATLPHGSYY